MTTKVLIVEDEDRIRHWVKSYFEKAGYEAITAEDGVSGLYMAKTEAPDLIILDLMLPLMDGTAVCRSIRKGSSVPIIMLTARGQEEDRIKGLNLGADDYVVKPFSPGELVARANAILRRERGDLEPTQLLQAGDIALDMQAHICIVDGKNVPLSRTQFTLLETFIRNKGQTLTREQLLDKAFGTDFAGFDRTIDVHIRRLRSRIEPDPSNPRYIHTVYGVGYRFEA